MDNDKKKWAEQPGVYEDDARPLGEDASNAASDMPDEFKALLDEAEKRKGV